MGKFKGINLRLIAVIFIFFVFTPSFAGERRDSYSDNYSFDLGVNSAVIGSQLAVRNYTDSKKLQENVYKSVRSSMPDNRFTDGTQLNKFGYQNLSQSQVNALGKSNFQSTKFNNTQAGEALKDKMPFSNDGDHWEKLRRKIEQENYKSLPVPSVSPEYLKSSAE